MRRIGERIEVTGELVPLDGKFAIKGEGGERWTLKPCRHSTPYMGKRVTLKGEMIGFGGLKLLEIRRAD